MKLYCLSALLLLTVLLCPAPTIAQSSQERSAAVLVQEPDNPGEIQDEGNQEKQTQSDDEKVEGDADGEDSPQDDDSDSESRSPKSRGRKRGYTKQSDEFITVFAPVVSSTSSAVVKIVDGKQQVALGTVVDSNGLILTKASELQGDPKIEFADGSQKKPEILGVDPDTDLALLKVDATGLNFVRFEDIHPPIGAWLATVGLDDTPVSIGIVSHLARKISNDELNSAVIGIFPENREEGEGVRINIVLNDSAAEAAGLLVNDVILEIDSQKIVDRNALMETLSHYHPGDEISLKIMRDDKEMEVPVILGKRDVNPMMDRGNRQNRMGSTLSKRRSDFPLALQHDSTLNADEVGSPIVDLDGKIVGINIARDGRVSSLALPNEIVVPVIARLKTGKFKPAMVNKSQIRLVEKQLAKLDNELGDLPSQKTEKDMEFAAGNAVEQELELQVQQAEERLNSLRERLDNAKEKNKALIAGISELDSKRKRIERKKEPLQQELKLLKTGVR